MKINEFRFINNNESFIDKDFVNWSRCYEWGYVLSSLKNVNNNTIHNTCSGPGEIHKSFHDKLSKTNNKVDNSDIFETNINKTFDNFYLYNLLDKNNKKYDFVLCISTLEELDKNSIKVAFNNLLDQVKDGGRLIITCDYPDVDVGLLEEILNTKCRDSSTRLNGANSVYKQEQYTRLNVILIDITK